MGLLRTTALPETLEHAVIVHELAYGDDPA